MLHILNRGRLLGIALLGCLCLLGMGGLVEAQQEERSYAILIVGDEGNKEMHDREKVLINEMAKRIRQQQADQRLPIFSYHFNKERERTYCENRLNVLNEDLLFVGIVTLKNKVPLKVVYRIDRIVNAPRGAKDVLGRAEELQAENAPPAVVASPTPSASPEAPDGVIPEDEVKEGFRVQLGLFVQPEGAELRLKEAQEAGMTVEVIETRGPDGDLVYKVVSPAQEDKEAALQLLEAFKEAGFDNAFVP